MSKKKEKNLRKKYGRGLFIVALTVFCLALLAIALLRRQAPPIHEEVRIYVPTGSSYESLVDSLDAHDCIVSRSVFNLFAHTRGLSSHVKPGSYLIEPGSTLIGLVQKLSHGNQDAIRITINKHRTPEQLCQYLDSRLELSADDLLELMRSDSACASYGETPASIIGLFIQNTYEVYWNISPTALLNRMNKESQHFWAPRQQQLEELQMTRQQVLTVASIVEEETNANEEKADIASVYLNRLRIRMPLQADPTVKYAVGDFSIRRIKGTMLVHPSPYNTYSHAGLPPGPICIPSESSINAVLENKKTGYLYFCAKEDFSGRHNFSSSLSEHSSNAKKFHNALNSRNIH